MTRLFGLISNDPHALCCALEFLSKDLDIGTSKGGDGWGIGYYQRGQALVHKHPTVPVDGIDIVAELDKHPSDLVVAHIRSATKGRPKVENTHPFKYRRFLLAHKGFIESLVENMSKYRNDLPEHLSRPIRGDTDSEVLFYMILSAIRDVCGGLDKERLSGSCISSAMRAVFSQLKSEGKLSSAVIFADGDRLAGACLGQEEMHYRLMENVPSCTSCRNKGRPAALHHVRFIAVAAGLDEPPNGWSKMKKDRVLVAERDMGIEIGVL